MVTDPISNMIISLKNASVVSKDTVVVPFSNLKMEIAQCLKKNSYIEHFSKKTEKKNIPVIEIKLRYTPTGPAIHDVKRVSKPSRRSYVGVKEIFPVRNGTGMTVLTTPKGVLSDKEARKEMVGGEALFMIW